MRLNNVFLTEPVILDDRDALYFSNVYLKIGNQTNLFLKPSKSKRVLN